MKRVAAVMLLTLAVAACGEDDSGAPADKGRMILATTTSTQDSGLLDELVPGSRTSRGAR